MPTAKRPASRSKKGKTWEERWDAVLEEIRRGVPPDITDEEIERDIAEAITESRPKVQRKYSLTSAAADEFLALLRERAEIVGIAGTLQLCRDPNDDMLIETALIGHAEVIVTGDNDLLTMTHPDIQFLTAADFLRLLDPSE